MFLFLFMIMFIVYWRNYMWIKLIEEIFGVCSNPDVYLFISDIKLFLSLQCWQLTICLDENILKI